jgi:hypothetical protein
MEHVKRIVKGEYVFLEAEPGYALEVKDQPGVLRPQVEIKLEEEWKVKVVPIK